MFQPPQPTDSVYRDFARLKKGEKLGYQIVLSNGGTSWIQLFTKTDREGAVTIVQYGEKLEKGETVMLSGAPVELPDQSTFKVWLANLISTELEQFPYITVEPVDVKKIARRDDDSLNSMYL